MSGWICLVALLVSMATESALGAATITVNTLLDITADDGLCSLREAIKASNDDVETTGCAAGAGIDRIEFSVTGTITLASSMATVFTSVDVAGAGAADLTIDGVDLYRPFMIGSRGGDPNQTIRIGGLTLRRGTATSGGGISIASGHVVTLEDLVIEDSHATLSGGGLHVSYSADPGGATVTCTRCLIQRNSSDSSGGGVSMQFGGSELTFIASALIDNEAVTDAGALWLGDLNVVRLERSTMSGNRAGDDGGAVALVSNVTLTLVDSTVTDNTADFDADDDGAGGGIATGLSSTVTLGNSIVAGNHDDSPTMESPDVEGTFVTLGYNLIGDNTGATTSFPDGAPNGNFDTVGTAASPIVPLLGALAANGGPTPTHAPIVDVASPVIDAGSCAGALRDQRGYGNADSYYRIVDTAAVDADDGCDRGAVEVDAVEIDPVTIFLNGFETGDTRYWVAVG